MINYQIKPYLTYDKYGLCEVRCMYCDKSIKSRMEEPSKIDPKRFVYAISKHANYREIPVLLSDSTVAFLMVCDEHEGLSLSVDDLELFSQMILDGKKLEMENQGRPKAIIDATLEHLSKKRVVRRLTQQEINERFGGK